jgi:Putative MetA-pathway of phenol degradation
MPSLFHGGLPSLNSFWLVDCSPTGNLQGFFACPLKIGFYNKCWYARHEGVMMRAILILLLAAILPPSLCAQGGTPTVAEQATASASSLPAADDANDAQVSSTIGGDAASASALEQQSKSPSQQKPKPANPKPGSDLDRLPIEGSMVGYIDNAIVGSQVRVRFDAAFDDNFPDRAEFFYAKCSCYTQLNHTKLQNAYDPNAAGPGPGIPTTLNLQQLYFNVEYAPTKRFSVFTEVPLRWIQPQGFVTTPFNFAPFGNQAGLSDVQAGFKFAMVASSNHYFTFQFRTYFPSGDSSKGLGTNHYSVEPSVLYYQRLTDRWTAEGQLGDWHPIGGDAGVPISSSEGFAGDIFSYGIGPAYQLYKGERVRFTPVVELFGWTVLSGFQTEKPGASKVNGTSIVNLKAGVRTSIGNRNSFYVGFGQALTHELWYKHIIRLEYRYSF